MPTPEDEYYFQKMANERILMEKRARRILDVDSSADDTEIKKAYWLLAMKYHPDKNPNNKETLRHFQNIQNAYEFLIKKRDKLHVVDEDTGEEKPISEEYNTDNNWGYFLWWRDKYFQ